jgi:hypothetical protein
MWVEIQADFCNYWHGIADCEDYCRGIKDSDSSSSGSERYWDEVESYPSDLTFRSRRSWIFEISKDDSFVRKS